MNLKSFLMSTKGSNADVRWTFFLTCECFSSDVFLRKIMRCSLLLLWYTKHGVVIHIWHTYYELGYNIFIADFSGKHVIYLIINEWMNLVIRKIAINGFKWIYGIYPNNYFGCNKNLIKPIFSYYFFLFYTLCNK